MKCLPASKTAESKGYVLHDWHAEVLALRALNHFLLQECSTLSRDPCYRSKVLQWWDGDDYDKPYVQPFIIRHDLRFHMYSSEAPCGDASMELVMEAQEDATPWPIDVSSDDQFFSLPGRANFSKLGVVRRKPGNEQ